MEQRRTSHDECQVYVGERNWKANKHPLTPHRCSASIIPIVKALFRRPRHDEDSSNDTEYAFKKSRSLISRILASTRRPGIATVAFFVFAVLYVFQNEVTLRAGRSVQKRLQRLADKVERSGGDVTEEDIKLLSGWRWRILTWAS